MPDAVHVPPPAAALLDRFERVRARTLALAEPLSAEDMAVQSMPDASPVKWHLAHTTWFFETFLLLPHAGAAPVDPAYGYLFNSYYEAAGPRHARPKRGLLTRPSLADVLDYRSRVDGAMRRWLAGTQQAPEVLALLELGLNHEEQHQELILTDLKHLLSENPLKPAYAAPAAAEGKAPALSWHPHPGGLAEIGHAGPGFAFDNEGPRHRVWLEPFELASRPVTAGEYLEFVLDGGYRDPRHWLSDGWAAVQAQGWAAPAYWREEGGRWLVFTLSGERPLAPDAPACHLSHYEADAYARWAGCRLPTEAEWETVAAPLWRQVGQALHPPPAAGFPAGVWEWTASAYLPYPRFRPAEGAVGEYNGKFMSGQMVLRGASCATPAGHSRPTYRNFFPPGARWQVSGLRLARDA
ncbi:MAG TPA: ergothioneine biosynthesis protein EgtB [Azospirillaceae bacterium]|nr:ergothioneine biosynthesis protein EgtB [Azospirillaceae bacterium]